MHIDDPTAPATPANNFLSLFDSLDTALKRSGTGDAFEALGVLDQLRAAHKSLIKDVEDARFEIGNVISLVNVAALALRQQDCDADSDVADMLDRSMMADLHSCRDSLENIQRNAGGVRS